MPERIGGDAIPAALKDVARTFEESNVSVTHSDTRTDNGSVVLDVVDGSTATRPADNDSSTYAGAFGIRVTPNVDLGGLTGTISANTSGATTARILDTDESEIASTPISGGSVTVRADLPAGQDVYFVADAEESEWQAGTYYDSQQYPYSSSDLELVDGFSGVNGEESFNSYTFTDVTGMLDATSGSVIVEWVPAGEAPTDAVGWDVAFFSVSHDGETVDVFVEEDQTGGWTEIDGPMSRGDSISADPTNDVRFRVDFSRSDTANDPTLDSILRRFKL